MRTAFCLALLMLFSAPTPAEKEPQWLSSLAYGNVPDCPKNVGVRTHRSEATRGFGLTISIFGESHRGESGCTYSAVLDLKGKKNRVIRLPGPKKYNYTFVDFSPDGQALLLTRRKIDNFPNLDFRDIEISVLNLEKPEMNWVNVWDILGWRECDATVEPQGFNPEGKVVLRPRPAVWSGHQRPNCVKRPTLFATKLEHHSAQKLPDDAKVQRYGKATRVAFEACMSDPDIVGACFVVHGRLQYTNGSPGLRIWRIGTNRMLGVSNEILPQYVAEKMDGYETQAFGDFTVCPFTKERPGEMQMVCIESAERVVYRKD